VGDRHLKFYESRDNLGPLAAELDRLWRAKGTMRGGTVRERARP
jgi:hypothetical protein